MTLQRTLAHIDYRDAFHAELQWAPCDAEEFFRRFRESSPGWARVAARIRDALVAPLHLHATHRSSRRLEARSESLEFGQRLGPFVVIEVTAHEVTVGDDDRHLRFRFRCSLDGPQLVTATTEVEYQNTLGRFYFAMVKPFHWLIVKRTLARAASRE